MAKIKLITDSASDIPDTDLKTYNIDMLSIPIAVDGVGFYERESFSFEEYYQLLNNVSEIPVTSLIPQQTYLECYEKNYVLGFEHLINVTISGTGSGTITSALRARDEFYDKHPEAKDKYSIHIIDSRTYSMAYGWPVIQGAKMALEGKGVEVILSYLQEWFKNVEIYLACYTLAYAKKSGRIGAATAFIGEVLGMRPIILMKDGATYNIAKVRGDNKVPEGLLSQFRQKYQRGDEALIVCGEWEEPALELQAKFKKEFKIVAPIYKAGASIVTNAGPKMLAIVCMPSL